MPLKGVAAACGVSEAALYRHFRSKDELGEAVIASLHERLGIRRFLADLEAEEDLERILTKLARFIVRRFGEAPEAARLLLDCSLRGADFGDPAFRALRQPFVSFLKRKLDRLQRRGEIRHVHSEITARCFIGMVMDCSLSAELWARVQGRRYPRERMIRNNVSIYVRGLSRGAAVGGRAAPPARVQGKRRAAVPARRAGMREK
jgi:AcrR family transcriptional regulator